MPRIEDYALIGDCETAALVTRDGSIDWLCWPRFDSGACFAAILGGAEHGRWQIAPLTPPAKITRRYRDGTLILETLFESDEGAVRLVDFMPVRDRTSDLVRIVEGVRGKVTLRSELILRFDYGSIVPWVSRLDDGSLRAIAGPDMVVLRSSVETHGESLKSVAEFTLSAGERAHFVLTYTPSHLPPAQSTDPDEALARTETFWREWSDRGTYRGPFEAEVKRSLITLKALTYAPTGGVVAAPTTSLPEHIGGVRNWDYRYCWLRDATFTLLTLMDAGYHEEADQFRDWLLRAVASSHVQIMFGVAGERRLLESELDWLPGYEGSRPVRVGNAAAAQLQLDVYGEVTDALHQARRLGCGAHDAGWELQRNLVEHLEQVWMEPDEGIWEVRSGRQQFVHSKVMAWVALDRSLRSAEEFGLEGPLERWRALRAKIHAQVCKEGFNEEIGAFTQAYGSKCLDASLLMMPLVGFLPATDPRVKGTIEAIEKNLRVDGMVRRYQTEESDDGLPPGEGAFLACNFWLADCLSLLGRHDEACTLFKHLLSMCNDVGLLAEEYDPIAKRQLGNFPQALSHLALVGTALNLARGERPLDQRPNSGERGSSLPPRVTRAGTQCGK